MIEEEYDELHDLMTIEALHALVEAVSAVRKTLGHELHFNDKLKDISLYEFLELKLKNYEINYGQTAKLLKISFREFEFFNTLIQNLIGYYSKETSLVLHRTPTDINRLLEEVITLYEGLAREKQLKITLLTFGDSLLRVDKQLIRRVFINLLDNAVKYSYDGGTNERFIKIECHRHSIKNDWLISFESYGVGITEEEVSNGSIFDYGVRGVLSTNRGRSGTGIGLAETKRIIDAHNGKIRITSTNAGLDAYKTTIKIILPLK
jgi:two-component system phosphate regulon sensor histidine kinase PhoR